MNRAVTPLDRSQPPAAGALRPFRFPPFERLTIGNGLELLIAPIRNLPLIDLHLIMPAGGQYGSLERPGIAGLHAALLDEGTAASSALDLAGRMGELGGTMASGADWDTAAINIGVLSPHLDAAVALLAEIALEPSFPPAELERLRRDRRTRLLRRRDQPQALAMDTFIAAAYPETVYATPLLGTPESLAAIERDEVLDFYRAHAVPSAMTLIAVGDLDAETLMARVEAAFGAAAAGTPPRRQEIVATPLETNRVLLVDRPQGAQTQLLLGHPSVSRSEPGHLDRMVMSAILGGSFTSRLNTTLRQRHGYTYGVSSRFAVRQGPGPFYIRAAVATESTGHAIEETLREIRLLQDEGVGDEELRDAHTFLAGLFAYSLQSVDQVSQRLENLVVFDLDEDYLRHFSEHLQRVDAEAVRGAARRYVHPDRFAIVAVGPAEQLRPQLEPFGPVEVIASDPSST